MLLYQKLEPGAYSVFRKLLQKFCCSTEQRFLILIEDQSLFISSFCSRTVRDVDEDNDPTSGELTLE